MSQLPTKKGELLCMALHVCFPTGCWRTAGCKIYIQVWDAACSPASLPWGVPLRPAQSGWQMEAPIPGIEVSHVVTRCWDVLEMNPVLRQDPS